MTEFELRPIKVSPYLTIVEGRKPRQKVHTALSHAKNAFDTPKWNPLVPGYRSMGGHTHAWGALYEYNGTEWKLIFEIKQPTEADRREGKYRDVYETRPWRVGS